MIVCEEWTQVVSVIAYSNCKFTKCMEGKEMRGDTKVYSKVCAERRDRVQTNAQM
jgi:hypothetical protein